MLLLKWSLHKTWKSPTELELITLVTTSLKIILNYIPLSDRVLLKDI